MNRNTQRYLTLGLALSLLACAPSEASDATAQDVTDASGVAVVSQATYRIERLPYSTYLTVSLIGDDGERLVESLPGTDLDEAFEDVEAMDRAGADPERFVLEPQPGTEDEEHWMIQLIDEIGAAVAFGHFDDREGAEAAAAEAASKMGRGDPEVVNWLSLCGLELLEGDGRYFLRKYISPASGPTKWDSLALFSHEFDSEDAARAAAGALATLAADPQAYRFGEDGFGHHFRVVDDDGDERLFSPDFATAELAEIAAGEVQYLLWGSGGCSAETP